MIVYNVVPANRHIFLMEISDSTIEYRVLDTRKFGPNFEYSNFRVIASSNRVLCALPTVITFKL
jgi:hypothetical protein